MATTLRWMLVCRGGSWDQSLWSEEDPLQTEHDRRITCPRVACPFLFAHGTWDISELSVTQPARVKGCLHGHWWRHSLAMARRIRSASK